MTRCGKGVRAGDWRRVAWVLVAAVVAGGVAMAAEDLGAPPSWTLSPPRISPVPTAEPKAISVKDPTVVFHEGKWHVFMTVRSAAPPVHIEYVTFEKWEDAEKAPRHVFRWHDRYFCAPQVFYFRPHRKWYLVYQLGEPSRNLKLQPAFATTENLADPASWAPGKLFFPDADPKGVSRWLDFWVVCDSKRAYLFFTSLDGNMWRMWTPLEKFPYGFDHCELALKADIFEASHTYRLAGREGYLTVIEAQGAGGRRYYKAYTAESLGGAWKPLADTEARPFAGAANVRQSDPPWADNISHGELLRAGTDETLPVDPANLKFLIQGVVNSGKGDQGYGGIPWRLGVLTAAPSGG